MARMQMFPPGIFWRKTNRSCPQSFGPAKPGPVTAQRPSLFSLAQARAAQSLLRPLGHLPIFTLSPHLPKIRWVCPLAGSSGWSFNLMRVDFLVKMRRWPSPSPHHPHASLPNWTPPHGTGTQITTLQVHSNHGRQAEQSGRGDGNNDLC